MNVASMFVSQCVDEFHKSIAPSSSKHRSDEDFAAALSPLQPSPLSQDEILYFFARLPSPPLLIARTGAPWKPIPSDHWQVPYDRELRPVGKHPIAAPGVWENEVGPALLQVLDEENVRWNTIDVHRIHYYLDLDDGAPYPVVVCIGVKFGLLSGEDGARVANRCQAVLDRFGLANVEVAIKASERFQSAAPAFEKPVRWASGEKDPMVQSRMPFTSCVGFPLSSVACPDVQGSGGFFFTNGEDASKVYLLTARHVVMDTTAREKNTVYDHKASERPRRQDVTLFNEKGILEHMKTVRVGLGSQSRGAEIYKRWVDDAQAKLNDKTQPPQDRDEARSLRHNQRLLEEAQESMTDLETLYVDAAKLYLSELGRVLGFVSYAPPIGFSLGEHKYTEDVAIIEIDANKIDPSTFRPNVLDMDCERGGLMKFMNPPGWFTMGKFGAEAPFQYPADRLLQLRGIVPDAELRDPQQEDFNGDSCLMVLKRGWASGLTIGRLNNMPSYTKTYWEDGTSDVSMEWPIFSFRPDEGKYAKSFSEPGDSGSVVVDGSGRIVGIITGGAGFNEASVYGTSTVGGHVTYVMAADFIHKQMLARGIDMNVNFTLG